MEGVQENVLRCSGSFAGAQTRKLLTDGRVTHSPGGGHAFADPL